MMNTESGAELAQTVRRTDGDLRQPKGGGSTVGAMGVVPCLPSGGVAAKTKQKVESKKRKGPGFLLLHGREYDFMRFGSFVQQARNWLYDAQKYHRDGYAESARMCVACARQAGAMARTHYACALAARKGVAA